MPQRPRQPHGPSDEEPTVITGGNFGMPSPPVPPVGARGDRPRGRLPEPPLPQYHSPFGAAGPKTLKSRVNLSRTILGAGGAVMAVVAVVAGVALWPSPDQQPDAKPQAYQTGDASSSLAAAKTPGDAVKGYLESLAAGDADKALSYGRGRPGSKEFLNAEILKKQISAWPITSIQVLETRVDEHGQTRVHTSVKFGDKSSDEQVAVVQADGGWKLQYPIWKLTFADPDSMRVGKITQVFGRPVKEKQQVYVFPGFLGLTATTPNLDLVYPSDDVMLKSIAGSAAEEASPMITVKLSAIGERNIRSGFKAAIDACAQSKLLKPPNCPQSLGGEAIKDIYVEGSVTWTSPDVSQANCTFNELEFTSKCSDKQIWKYAVDLADGSGRETGTKPVPMNTKPIDMRPPELKVEVRSY